MKKNADVKWDHKMYIFFHTDGRYDQLIMGSSGFIYSNSRLKWVNMWGFKGLNGSGGVLEIIGDP